MDGEVGWEAGGADLQALTPPRERGVVGGLEINTHQRQHRPQEPLRLAQRQLENKPECQCGLDRQIGEPRLPAGRPDGDGAPRIRSVAREPQGHVASLDERLIADTYAKQGIAPGQLTVHADRGAAMTSKPVALLLADLGVTKTHSRPHVSNDNPFSEAQFKTLKYCPAFPERFGSLEDGRAFGHHFFGGYNHDHYHSGLGVLTPAVVHYGQAEAVHAHRTRVLAAAYATHPERFVKGPPKPADLPQAVWINPPVKKNTAQDAPGTTIGTPVDLQDPLISRSREHSAATTIDVDATLITSPLVSQCH